MGRHIARRPYSCPACGSTGERLFIAEARPLGLRFAASFRCPGCAQSQEYDGAELSDEARVAFIADEGEWALYLSPGAARGAETVRVVRDHFCLPLPEASRLVRGDGPLMVGAMVELEQLEMSLSAVGAGTEMVRTR